MADNAEHSDRADPPNTAVLMFIAHRAMEVEVLTAMSGAGHTVTLAQARVFQRIAPGGSRLTELAEQAQVTKQTAGFLVDQLQSAGYVERVADPSDARARLIRLSERGRTAADMAAGVVRDVERDWRRHLGAKRWGQLREALVRLREVTDPWAS